MQGHACVSPNWISALLIVAVAITLVCFSSPPTMAAVAYLDEADARLAQWLDESHGSGLMADLLDAFEAALSLTNPGLRLPVDGITVSDKTVSAHGPGFGVRVHPISADGDPRLLVYLRGGGLSDGDGVGLWTWRILCRVPGEGSFFNVPIDGVTAADEFMDAAPIKLGPDLTGLIVGGFSGVAARVGHVALLVPTAYSNGYRIAAQWDVPSLRFGFSNDDSGEVYYGEYAQWDGFPVTDFSHLDMVGLYDALRRFEVTERWDAEAGRPLEIARIERMHPFAAVNHLLRALRDSDEQAVSALMPGHLEMHPLVDALHEVLEDDTMSLYYLRFLCDEIAVSFGYRIAGEDELETVVIAASRSNDFRPFDFEWKGIEAILIFRTTPGDDATIVAAAVYRSDAFP